MILVCIDAPVVQGQPPFGSLDTIHAARLPLAFCHPLNLVLSRLAPEVSEEQS